MLKLNNVSKYYQSATNPVKALDSINIDFKLNEFVAITGESGSGKSTFLNIVTGMDTYEEGEMLFKGNKTSFFDTKDLEQFRKKHVSYILQTYGLIDSYTVLDNIMLPLLIDGVNRDVAKEKAMKLIKDVDLLDKVKTRVSILSGGEKQRVSIARALITDKEILACDEITANLDRNTSIEIVNLIKKLAKDKLVLFVTHDYNLVKNIATRHVVLSDGKILIDNNTLSEDVSEDEMLDLSYKPLKNKTVLKLATSNILLCPKRTLQNTMLFIAISLIISLLLSFISFPVVNVEDNYRGYITDEYYMIYKGSNDDVKGHINTRAFIDEYIYDLGQYTYSFTTHILNKDKLEYFKGEEPKNSNEIIYYSYVNDQRYRVGDEIKLFNNYTFTISGIGYNNNIYIPIISYKVDGNEDFYLRLTELALSDYLGEYNNLNYRITTTTTYNPNLAKSKLYIPSYLYHTDLYMGNYDLRDYCDIVLVNNNTIKLEFNDEILKKLDSLYSSVYANDMDEVKHNLKVLKHSDFYYPYDHRVVNTAKKAFSLFMISLAFIVSTLLYIVISSIVTRLNNQVIRDYSIYRMLGVSKEDNKKIIFLYNFILSFIIFNLVYFLQYFYFSYTRNLKFNLAMYIVFLLGIILFNVKVTKKTTTRVYENTNIKVLKEE